LNLHWRQSIQPMALGADDIIDRRALRKKISFWRIAAFALVAALIVSLFYAGGLFERFAEQSSEHIARVKIEGTITNDRALLALLAKLEKNDRVKAVILNISSPGGTTVGGEAIFEAVRAISKEKPIVTSVGTLAASAGYMIASATDHIVARRSSIIGSIGVLFQYGDISRLLDRIGVKIDAVKSSPLKAEPSPFNETTPEERAVLDRVVQDSYQWFIDLVAERRNMSEAAVRILADGSIYSGAQSLKNGLVDAIGGEDKAKDWLVAEKSISKDIKILDWKAVRPGDSLFENPAGIVWVAKLFGINLDNSTASSIRKAIPRRLFLDGLLSVWLTSGGEAATGKIQ